MSKSPSRALKRRRAASSSAKLWAERERVLCGDDVRECEPLRCGCVSGEVVLVLEALLVEAEREARVGLKAVRRLRMVSEGLRSGWKDAEKRLLRVDIVVCVVRVVLRSVSRSGSARGPERRVAVGDA